MLYALITRPSWHASYFEDKFDIDAYVIGQNADSFPFSPLSEDIEVFEDELEADFERYTERK